MNTLPTPETDKISQWSDNHGWIVDIDFALKLERERDEAREHLVKIEAKMCAELGGHPNSQLWGESGLIAATMRCVDALGEAIEQRDEARKNSENAKAYKRVLKVTNAVLKRERDEAREESIRWQSIAEGRGRTDDEEENDTQCELAAWELLREAQAENIGWQNKWQVAVEMAARAENQLAAVTAQRDRLAEAVNAATILIAAKGRHNTMLAYEGLRATLQSLTPKSQ